MRAALCSHSDLVAGPESNGRQQRAAGRPLGAVLPYWPMPACLNVSVMAAVSSLTILSIAAGVSVTPIRNCALILASISGVLMASAQSLLIFSRIGFGTAAGAIRPNQES